MRRMYALIVKEYYQIFRDPSSLLIAVVLPLILLFVYGYGISLDITQMKVACVMEDRGPSSQSFVQALKDSSYFSLIFEDSSSNLTWDLSTGKVLGGIEIPSYFSDFEKNSCQIAPIFVTADGSQPNTANFVQNYLRGAFRNWQAQNQEEQGIGPPPLAFTQPRFWFNEELDSHHFLIPGSIAIIMALIGTILTALVIAREWERGTMEALMATKASIYEILLSKLIPYFFLGLVTMLICTTLGCMLFGVPFRGSIGLLFVATAFFLVASLGMGLLISSFARNQFNAAQIALVAGFLPAFMLSGFIFEISSMPFRIQLISLLLPARYFVSSLQTLFLVGDVKSLVFLNCLANAIFSIVLFSILSFKSVKRLEG